MDSPRIDQAFILGPGSEGCKAPGEEGGSMSSMVDRRSAAWAFGLVCLLGLDACPVSFD